VAMTTTPNRQARFVFFLTLAIIGLVTAMVFNGIASIQGQNYLDAWFGSAVDWVLSLDILIVAIAGSALMTMEAKRLGMKRVWLYIGASGVTAFAFTFPLFLAMRERKLAQLEEETL
jgi:Terpene cyclase DEP1